MWKYVGEGRTIPGVPASDMTDEEFEAVEARYDAQFDAAQKGALRTCGLYDHETGDAAAGSGGSGRPSTGGKARRSGQPSDPPPTSEEE